MSKSSTPAKDWDTLAKKLRKLGCTIQLRPGGTHRQVFHNGELVATLQQSRSGHRSYLNTIARLRRAGITV